MNHAQTYQRTERALRIAKSCGVKAHIDAETGMVHIRTGGYLGVSDSLQYDPQADKCEGYPYTYSLRWVRRRIERDPLCRSVVDWSQAGSEEIPPLVCPEVDAMTGRLNKLYEAMDAGADAAVVDEAVNLIEALRNAVIRLRKEVKADESESE
jgi:hypothetical protein